MSKGIKPQELSDAIEYELSLYAEDVTERINAISKRAAQKLVKLTRATAPVGKSRKHYKDSITVQEKTVDFGNKKYIWHVKSPNHRITHLLIRGHATRNGGRTKSNPFLKNAVDIVIPEYVQEVEETIKNGK